MRTTEQLNDQGHTTEAGGGSRSKTMRAIVQDQYGGADALHLEEIALPLVGERDVLVRVHAAGVDRGVLHLMTGQPYIGRLVLGLRRPNTRVPGMNLAGVVVEVGSAVTRFRPGDEVYGGGDGAFAEYASVAEGKLALKPTNLTFEQAAAVPVSGVTALKALRTVGRVQAGQTVLVIGASGGVGSFAVQIAKALGARVTAVCSTSKIELVRSIGADDVVDYTREDFADRPERYDLIVDIAGNRSLSHLRRALTPHGTIVITGGEEGGKWFGGMDRQIRGAALSLFVRQNVRSFVAMANAEDLQTLTELIEARKVTPVIDRSYSLEDVPTALRYLEAGLARGKVVIAL